MKKLAVTLSLLAVAAGAFAQGSVNPGNTGTTRFQTNSVGAGGTVGNAASASGPGFYYEVLTAPSTVTSVDSSLQALLSGPWSDTGLRATNAAIAGSSSGATGVANWNVGVSQSYIVVGWSGSLGTTWSQVSAELAGAVLNNGVWTGAGFASTPGGWLGATGVGWRQAGGVVGSTTIPTAGLFGTVDDAHGTTINTPTSLFIVNVPEPTSFALAGLGAAALMIFRRRKA